MNITQKTIAITYDDASHMIDYCKDEDNNIKKDFYDWYLSEKGDFFERKGVVILTIGERVHGTFDIHFDFTDPDCARFEIYPHDGKYAIYRYYFERQNNITMDKIKVHIIFFNERLWKEIGYALQPIDIAHQFHNAEKELRRMKTRLNRAENKNQLLTKTTNTLKQWDVLKDKAKLGNCMMMTYFVYALMYYIATFPKEEIECGEESNVTDEKLVSVKSIYKYTGYVDLRKNKIYNVCVRKDPNEPIREYQRHIEAWSVRGHYRKTNNGLIWIEPHIKGSGELEQRVYSTIDEEKLNLPAKVFDVNHFIKTSEKSKSKPDVIIHIKMDDTIKPIKENKLIAIIKVVWENVLQMFKSK